MRDCTVLVNSCDKYEDLWNPFFTLFKKYWPTCSYDIILNTEQKKYQFNGLDIKTYAMSDPTEKWGERFLKHLSKVDTEYVIVLLYDFFFRDYVREDRLNSCVEAMNKDKSITCFSFCYVDDENNMPCEYEGFEQRPQKGDYRFNLQAALWRTKDLISYIFPEETPWEWEEEGNIRSYVVDKKFYVTKHGYFVFNYGFKD